MQRLLLFCLQGLQRLFLLGTGGGQLRSGFRERRLLPFGCIFFGGLGSGELILQRGKGIPVFLAQGLQLQLGLKLGLLVGLLGGRELILQLGNGLLTPLGLACLLRQLSA